MSLDRRAVFGLLIGRMGGGKTWSLVRYLVDEWLPLHEGRFICNLPLNVEAICEYCEGVHGLDAAEVRQRIHVIPDAVCLEWISGIGSPGEYLDVLYRAEVERAGCTLEEAEELGVNHPLCKALVVVDEAGSYFPAEPPREQAEICRKTARWISKVRHEGARVIFCCQNEMQLVASIRRLLGFQIHLTDLGEWLEPLSGILVSDWFQVVSKITGRPLQWVKQEEFVGNGSALEVQRVRRWFLTKRYFALYNSRNRERGGQGEEERPEWQRFGWLRFVRWFVRKNLFGLSRAVGVVAAALILLWPGMVAPKCCMWLYREANELLGEVRVKSLKKQGVYVEKTSSEPGGERSNVAKDDSGKEEKGPRAPENGIGGSAGSEAAIVFLTPKLFMTEEGASYEIGDLVQGQMVMRIDAVRGEVLLDGGGRLRLGGGLRAIEAARVERAVVQRSLRGSGGGDGGAKRGAEGGKRAAIHVQRTGDAAGAVRAAREFGNGHQRSSVRSAARAHGDAPAE